MIVSTTSIVPLLTVICIMLGTYCPAQISALTMAQADSSMQREPKPLLILLSTDWCRYCRMQKNQLRKNKDFQSALSQFCFAELDAESRETIRFRGRSWAYRPTGESVGIHSLAEALTGGEETAYPAWVLLDKAYQPIFHYNGVLTAEQLKILLRAIETIHNTQEESVADF